MKNNYVVDVYGIVMYGLFPFVMHDVVECLSDGRPFLLHVVRDGPTW